MAGQDGEGEKPQIIREVKEEPLEEQLREVGDVIGDTDALSTLAKMTADEPALDLLPDDERPAIGEIQTLAVEPPAAKGPAQEERGKRQRKTKKKTTTDAGVATPTAVEATTMTSNPNLDQDLWTKLDTLGIEPSKLSEVIDVLDVHSDGERIQFLLEHQLSAEQARRFLEAIGEYTKNDVVDAIGRLQAKSEKRKTVRGGRGDRAPWLTAFLSTDPKVRLQYELDRNIVTAEGLQDRLSDLRVMLSGPAVQNPDALTSLQQVRDKITTLEEFLTRNGIPLERPATVVTGEAPSAETSPAAPASPSGPPEEARQPVAPVEAVPVAPPAAVDEATTAGEAPAPGTTAEPQASAPDAPAADAPPAAEAAPAPETATSAPIIIMDEWNKFRDENPGSTLGDYLQSRGGLERNGAISMLLHILDNLALDDAEISGRLWGRSMADHRDDLRTWGVDFMTADDFDTYLSEQFGVTTGTQKDTVYRAYVGAYAARKDEELRHDFDIEYNQDNGLTLGKYIVDRHINPASPPVLLNMMLRLSSLEITDVPLSPEEFRTSILRNWGMDGDNFPRDQYYAIYESVYKERQRGARPRERREDEPGSPTGREGVPGPDTPEEENPRDEFSDALKLAQDYAKKLEAGLGISKINEAAAAWRQHTWKENIEKGVKWTIAAAAILSIILGLVLNVPWNGALLGSGVAAIAGGGVLYGKGKTFDWWRGYSVKERKRMIAEGKWTNTLIGTVKSLKENGLWDVMEPSQQQSVLRMLDGFKTQSAASTVNAQAAVS